MGHVTLLPSEALSDDDVMVIKNLCVNFARRLNLKISTQSSEREPRPTPMMKSVNHLWGKINNVTGFFHALRLSKNNLVFHLSRAK